MPSSLQTNPLFLCGQISKRVHEHLTQAFKEFDVTVEQFSVLAFLWYAEAPNQQKLAEELERDKTTITRIIHNMEKKELLERRSDPEDLRNKRIYLTEAGKKLQHDMIETAATVYNEALKGLTENEIVTAVELLQKVNANLQ